MPEANRTRRSIIFAQTAKNLEQIFREQLEYARDKVGSGEDIKTFCAGLIALPRPVPIADLAAVTRLNEAYIRDLCADFAPGVRLTNGSIGFADEDFEHFVRTEAEAQLGPVQTRMADHFLGRHRSDAYAAARRSVKKGMPSVSPLGGLHRGSFLCAEHLNLLQRLSARPTGAEGAG